MDQELAGRTFYIRTFGCQMNENDSLHVGLLLEAAGASAVENTEQADVILVNTCAVREKSEDKLFSYLGRLASLKKRKPVLIGVLGCVAQIYGRKIAEKTPVVDFIVGPQEYPDLVDIILKAENGLCVRTGFHTGWRETGPSGRPTGPSAYITIMEGCDNFCTFCVVPFSRGREKSRPLSLIIDEARILIERGAKEIQLLGQNVNSWRDPESGRGLPELLDETCALPGVKWLRFISSNPKNFSPELVMAMKRNAKVCRHLHLPAQSGSSAVLKAMNRGYSRDDYLNLVDHIRNQIPGIMLSTDIIVGFPGESEEDFEATLEILTRIRFASIFSFRYSPRPRTPAAGMEDAVPVEEKRRRLILLQELQKSIQLEINSSFVGKSVRVLCTGESPKAGGRFTGRTSGNMVVNFDSERNPAGEFVTVRITDYGPYSLHGREEID